MNFNLASSLDIDSVLREVLRAAMAVQNTDLGLLSLTESPTPIALPLKCNLVLIEEFLKTIAKQSRFGSPLLSGATCHHRRRQQWTRFFEQYRGHRERGRAFARATAPH